ncbi:MAG: cyclodeaminase/cyclohydrolase family protein [Nanoarchaeota archaeon]|nr:cyclodeaminase/cyclohydrolase family protein [Nanoarchaeota archaeon]MCG2718129.1 cyclodeaminase/cyclohydrolase family protein [Nanoarchaeota archaeon]
MKLEEAIRKIESKDPAIGIGTAAGASGVLAARLVIKAAKKSNLPELQKEAEKKKKNLVRLINEDMKAFKNYMTAYKTKDDKKIQDALKYAIEIPIKIAEESYELMQIADNTFHKGKKSMVLEIYGAASLCKTSIQSATEIAKLNLEDIKDKQYKKKMDTVRFQLKFKAEHKEQMMYTTVKNYLYK